MGVSRAATLQQRSRHLVGAVARRALGRFGLEVHRRPPAGADNDFPPDFDEEAKELYRFVRPYTLTSTERVLALRNAVRYIAGAGIDGDICECGVWRGGSMMVVARTLVELGDLKRGLYMFDTFTRPPDAGPRDGPGDQAELDEALTNPGYAYLPVSDIRRRLLEIGYPEDKLHFVEGLVEDTIPEQAPEKLALLRLDTDYYSSTAHEMKHLYPRVAPGGVVIIDDYGQFVGARDAVDEYFQESGEQVLMHRIDFTGRLVIVPPGDPTPQA